MKFVASLTLLATAAAPALAQAPTPGSVLVFPSIRSTQFATTFISVTNTSLSPLVPAPGVQNPPDVLAYYNYVNAVQDPNDVYRPLACNHFCRPELLTPGDHVTVSALCHNPGDQRQGYLVVSAHSAHLVVVAVSHNYLAGSAVGLRLPRWFGVYVYNGDPVLLAARRVACRRTSTPANGRLDFDGCRIREDCTIT